MSQITLNVTNDPTGLMRAVQSQIEASQQQQLFLATVTEVTANTVKIQRTGQDPDGQEYAVLDNFPYPKVGDEVLVAKVGRGNMVLGHVLTGALTGNYLTIDTVLTMGPGGRIEDADGSTWDQDGITLRAPGDLETDFIQFENAAIPSRGLIQGVMSDALDLATMTFLSQYREAGPVIRASGALSASGRLDGANYRGEWILTAATNDTGGDSHSITLTSLEIHPTGGGVGSQTVILSSGSPDDGANAVNLSLMFPGSAFSSGKGLIGLGNRNAAPSANPVGGGYLYAEAGALLWRGSGGTTTTIAVA